MRVERLTHGVEQLVRAVLTRIRRLQPQHNVAAPEDEDTWISNVRAWRARPRTARVPSGQPRKPRKPDREQGPIASVLTVTGILLGAFFLFGFIVLNMNPTNYELQFSPDQLPATKVGDTYNAGIGVFHNASPLAGARVAEGKLPPGLSLVVEHTDSGGVGAIRISGSATTAGTYTFTVEAWTTGTDVLQYHVDAQIGSHEYVIIVS